MRGLALAALAFATMHAPAQGGSACDDAGQYGSLVDAAEFDAAVQALPPAAFLDPPVQPPLPAQARLVNLPVVAQQGTASEPGSPGSCEAQSFGYGLGSYTAAHNLSGGLKWNPAKPENSISAAYLYEQALIRQKGACPGGSLALPYLAQLASFGAAPRQLVPYAPSCAYLNWLPRAFAKIPWLALPKFRIGSYAVFHIDSSQTAALAKIKEFVANGQPVAFSGSVLCHYSKAPPLQNGVIYETDVIPNSGHGQLVVGYDDNVGTPGDAGALLIQNSFGVHWPPASAGPSPAPPGKVYWSYNTFVTTQSLAAVAYPAPTGPPPDPRLVASSASAPAAAVTRGFQWAPDGGAGVFLILTHVFGRPVLLDSVKLTEPGGAVAAAAAYGQYISAGYSYLRRTDANASFLAGTYTVALDAHDLEGKPVSYTGTIAIGAPRPNAPPGKSMAGQTITGSTGAAATLSP